MVEFLLGFYSIVFALDFIEMEWVLALHYFGLKKMEGCFFILYLYIPIWTARRSNQSILKEISPEYSSEGLMLKLNPLPWPSDVKSQLIGKAPNAGKD